MITICKTVLGGSTPGQIRDHRQPGGLQDAVALVRAMVGEEATAP